MFEGSGVFSISMKKISLAASAVALLALGGCSAVDNVITAGSGVDPQEATQRAMAHVAPTRSCPRAVIVEEGSVRQIFARGQEGNPRGVVYQAVLTEAARECAMFNNTLEFRVGVRGRFTPGAAAQAGQTVNLNVVLTYQDDTTVLWRSVRQVPVTLDPSQGTQEFSFIEENGSALIPEGRTEFNYRIRVSFEEERRR